MRFLDPEREYSALAGVWLYQPGCWKDVVLRRMEFHGSATRFKPVDDPARGDLLVIPQSATDLQACREEFFRVLTDPKLFP